LVVNVLGRPIYARRGEAPSVGSGDQTVSPSSALQRRKLHRVVENFGVARGRRQPRVAHADRPVGDSNKSNAERAAIDGPMLFESIGVGMNMKKGEPALPAQLNATLVASNTGGEIDPFRDKRLGPNTQYWLVRTETTVPLGPLTFTPIG
jgi:hypothetical protein